jgi:hypothetical protein
MRTWPARISVVLSLAALQGACLDREGPPSDDPADYPDEAGRSFRPRLAGLRWVVPSPALPPETPTLAANNNLDLVFHEERLFLAWRTTRLGRGRWTESETFGDPGEIPWNVKARGGLAFLTTYRGNHYAAGPSQLEVRFRVSGDGLRWAPLQPEHLVVYRGGVSEVAFKFDLAGDLWAVTRNEDGDETGFG